MKFELEEPGERIRQIAEIIREREIKELPTFYTISIETSGKMTPVAEKEEGYENFKAQVLNLSLKHSLSSMKIELFQGKSHNAKRINEYMIYFKKQEPKVSLKGFDQPEITPTEEVISLKGYFDERLNSSIRVMQLENDKRALADKIEQITEKYEPEMQRLKEEISEYEREIEKLMKEKENSLMNVALGSVGVKILEGAVQSKKVMEVLRGVMGEPSFNEFQQRLAGIDNEQTSQNNPQKETARIISQPDSNDPRQIALNYINKVSQKLSDQLLRSLFDITEMIEQKPQILEELKKAAENIFKTKVIRIDPNDSNK